jgi:hypothetical protein
MDKCEKFFKVATFIATHYHQCWQLLLSRMISEITNTCYCSIDEKKSKNSSWIMSVADPPLEIVIAKTMAETTTADE